MTYLLDTNHLAHARNGVSSVVQRLDALAEGERVVTSIIAVAEVMYGVECSIRREDNLRAFEEQLRLLDEVMPFTDNTARAFGTMKAALRRKGKLKADVDLLIATAALEAGAVLVTDDEALLAGDIAGLTVENWYSVPG